MNNSLRDIIGREMSFHSFVVHMSALKTYIGDSTDDIILVMVEILGIKCQHSTDEVSEKLELIKSCICAV
jgi:hypothetical protein